MATSTRSIGGVAAPWFALPVAGLVRVAAVAGAGGHRARSSIPMAHHIRSSIQPRLAVIQLAYLLQPGRCADARERARADTQAAYNVHPAIVERVGYAPVDVRPWEL